MWTIISTILGTFGGTLSGIAGWLWGLFQKHEAAVSQAAADEQAAIAQHASDGQESVADQDSAEAQLDRIKQQQEQLNQTQGVKP